MAWKKYRKNYTEKAKPSEVSHDTPTNETPKPETPKMSNHIFIGNDERVKEAVAKKLAASLGVEYLTLDKLSYLRPADKITGNNESDLADKKLREKFPQLKTVYDFGYKKEVAEKFKAKFGPEGEKVYLRAFQAKVLEDFNKTYAGKAVINVPVEFTSSVNKYENIVKQVLENTDPEIVALKNEIDPQYLSAENVSEVVKKIPNRVCANLPTDKTHSDATYSTTAVVEQHKKLGTTELDTSKFYNESGEIVISPKNEQFLKLASDANPNKPAETPEETKPSSTTQSPKKKKKNIFARFFGKVFGFAANVLTLGVYGLVKKQKQKAAQKAVEAALLGKKSTVSRPAEVPTEETPAEEKKETTPAVEEKTDEVEEKTEEDTEEKEEVEEEVEEDAEEKDEGKSSRKPAEHKKKKTTSEPSEEEGMEM